MSIRLSRRGTVAASRPSVPESTIPQVIDVNSGAAEAGTATVTPPAGAVKYLALVLGWTGGIQIPTGWSLVGNYADADYWLLFESTTSTPGADWIADPGSFVNVIVVGYDRNFTTDGAFGVTPTSPGGSATGECLVFRGIWGEADTGVVIGYPSGHTIGQRRSVFHLSDDWDSFTAVAHSERLTAGAVPSANWGVTGGHNLEAPTITILLYGDDSEPPSPGEGLVWADEFDGESGTGPDPNEWYVEHWPAGRVNEELQAYTPRLSNVFQDGQNLNLVARQEVYNGGLNEDGELVTGNYTSGRIASKKFFLYGRIEARAWVPAGQGFWSAFWLYGDSENDTIPWPAQGEIDIMEILNQGTTLYADAHGVTDTGDNWSWQGNETGNFSSGFHVYSLDWSPTELVFKVDDVEFHRVTKSQLQPNQIWPFDRRSLITINLAVGGTWPGSPSGSTPFPSTMLVDYVRVYDSTVSEIE